MGSVHKASQAFRVPIQMGGSEKIHPVVAPSELPRELGDRHHLQHRHADTRQLRQLATGGIPRSLLCEGSNVQLVNDLALDLDASPSAVAPRKGIRIYYLGRSMGTVGLESRGWVGVKVTRSIQPEPVEGSSASLGNPAGEVPISLPVELRADR